MSVNDNYFNEHKKNHKPSFMIIMLMTLIINFNSFRIFYAKIFTRPWSYAAITHKDSFHKPIRLFTIVYVIVICIPNILLNFYYLVARTKGPFWTTQL